MTKKQCIKHQWFQMSFDLEHLTYFLMLKNKHYVLIKLTAICLIISSPVLSSEWSEAMSIEVSSHPFRSIHKTGIPSGRIRALSDLLPLDPADTPLTVYKKNTDQRLQYWPVHLEVQPKAQTTGEHTYPAERWQLYAQIKGNTGHFKQFEEAELSEPGVLVEQDDYLAYISASGYYKIFFSSDGEQRYWIIYSKFIETLKRLTFEWIMALASGGALLTEGGLQITPKKTEGRQASKDKKPRRWSSQKNNPAPNRRMRPVTSQRGTPNTKAAHKMNEKFLRCSDVPEEALSFEAIGTRQRALKIPDIVAKAYTLSRRDTVIFPRFTAERKIRSKLRRNQDNALSTWEQLLSKNNFPQEVYYTHWEAFCNFTNIISNIIHCTDTPYNIEPPIVATIVKRYSPETYEWVVKLAQDELDQNTPGIKMYALWLDRVMQQLFCARGHSAPPFHWRSTQRLALNDTEHSDQVAQLIRKLSEQKDREYESSSEYDSSSDSTTPPPSSRSMKHTLATQRQPFNKDHEHLMLDEPNAIHFDKYGWGRQQ